MPFARPWPHRSNGDRPLTSVDGPARVTVQADVPLGILDIAELMGFTELSRTDPDGVSSGL